MFESGLIRGVDRFAVATGKTTPLRKSAPRKTIFERDTGSAWAAQLAERVLGKDEVTGSIPGPGSGTLLGRGGSGAMENLAHAPAAATSPLSIPISTSL